MIKLTITGPYTAKDQRKADIATKFIGRGSPLSSTNQYRIDFGALANSGTYHHEDIVFISAEGNRNGRSTPDYDEITRAINAGACFIIDGPPDRFRPYNIGEREIATFLLANNYMESSTIPGFWKINRSRT